MAHTSTVSLANYQLRLTSFEGPLDILLRMIERSQLDVTDISLVQVTDQFMAFVAELNDAPPETIADFTAVGSRLTVLKSRYLLPRPQLEEDEEPQSDLTRELAEYKRLKETAARLHERASANLVSYMPPPQGSIAKPNGEQRPTKPGAYEPTVLLHAIRRRLSAMPKPTQLIQARRVVSLGEMTALIESHCEGGTKVTYHDVVQDFRTRAEYATAFLAVLVLLRRRAVRADQTDLFGRINLQRDFDAESVSMEFAPGKEIAS